MKRFTSTVRALLMVLLAALPAGMLPGQVEPGFTVRTATRGATWTSPIQTVLTWPEAHFGGVEVTQYSLYRKIDSAAPYPRMPIASGIQVISDCSKLKALIPEGSPDWKLIQDVMGGGRIGVGDPCKLGSLSRTSAAFGRLQLLARTRYQIAMALGQGYRDLQVVSGKTYYYQLRGVVHGKEVVLATDLQVRAGFPVGIAPPPGLNALPGDSRILVYWGNQTEASGFDLFRATSPAGPYLFVNDAGMTSLVENDLQGNPLPEKANGLIDYQHWDPSGNPEPHLVGNTPVDGPKNGVTYYYKVASTDLLGFAGPLSAPIAATAQDTTAPAVPGEVTVVPDDAAGQIQIHWAAVTRDVDGHPEIKIKGYRVYRRADPNLPESAGTPVGALIPQPSAGKTLVYAFDTDPALRPPFGEQSFWYQVECEDQVGNVSARSTAISGHLKDIKPPAAPAGVVAVSLQTWIQVKWSLNSEPDLDGYQIYRGLCDQGSWACAQANNPTGADCDSSFALLGYLSQQDAIQNGAHWDDRSVPEGSPLCYAYLVKAADQAQNRNGTLPPDLATEIVVCQRLSDQTPPEAAVVTALSARDRAVQVEWVGAPVQDIAAYHVYRAVAEAGPYTFVGGLTVVEPPAQPVILNAPYQPQPGSVCDKVPLEIHEGMSIGSFLDTSATPKQIYWYVVRGIDQDGNEAQDGVPVSTFTYTAKDPQPPGIVTIVPAQGTCGLSVKWSPSFDPAQHRGFAVFRSQNPNGPYHQLGSLITASQFDDTAVAKGVTYWYRVLRLDLDGGVSPLSQNLSGKVN